MNPRLRIAPVPPGSRGRGQTLGVLLLALVLVGCAPGRSSYMPVTSGVDPYSRLRERAEEYYQAGLAYERTADWRNAAMNYDQALLWDPDGRTAIRERAAHAREMAATTDPQVAPTATLRPVVRPGETPPPISPTRAATSPAPTATRTPPPPATRRPTSTVPQAGYRAFRSKGLRYSLAYPTGWTVKEGAVNEAGTRADSFTGPVSGRAMASILVAGTTLPREIDSQQFYLQLATAFRDEEGFRELPARQVAGTLAYMATHTTVSGGKTFVVTHAILAVGNVGWLITLVAEGASLTEARAIFDIVLSSFVPEGTVS